jgi:hypothetical protein
MNFWIVAIDHTLQLTVEHNDPPELKAQKNHLKALLSSEISKHEVRFIAEESLPDKPTIAHAFAHANDPIIPWKNIMMTDAQRDAAGITKALKHRPGHPDKSMENWIDCRIPEDAIREDFFIDQTLQGAAGVQSVVILLGDMHVEEVGSKLAKMRHGN